MRLCALGPPAAGALAVEGGGRGPYLWLWRARMYAALTKEGSSDLSIVSFLIYFFRYNHKFLFYFISADEQ